MKKHLTILALLAACSAFPAAAQAQGPIPVAVDGSQFPPIFFPYYPNGYGRSGPIIYPGYSIGTPARTRPTIYPAIPTPPREVIRAALSGDLSNKAYLDMRLPASGAQVWLNGVEMKGQTGIQRRYVTPELKPGSTYTFQVVVQWRDEAGSNQRSGREITVRANAIQVVDLRLPTPQEQN